MTISSFLEFRPSLLIRFSDAEIPIVCGTYTNRLNFLEQLEQIRKVSMARIICDNTAIHEIQPLAFRKVGIGNKLTKCGAHLSFIPGIPMMDLSVFKE